MRSFQIPEKFFKALSEQENKLYVRIWFGFWLAGYVDSIFEPDFVEKQIEHLAKYKLDADEIKRIYQFGIEILSDGGFKIIQSTGKKQKIFDVNRKKAEQVLDHLNKTVGSAFSAKSENNIKIISDRINEGYHFHEFVTVIETKAAEWGNNPEMQQYLRPLTLFNKSKFENYLHAKKLTPVKT